MSGDHWLCIGTVGKAHGLGGDFFISSRDEVLPDSISHLIVAPSADEELPKKILRTWRRKGRPGVALEGICSPEDVRLILGQKLWAQRSQVPLLDQSEYFWDDLIGKPVVDSNAQYVGTIETIDNHGASDVIQLRHKDTKKTLSLPLVSFYFDMDFTVDSANLKLCVPLETFEDTWDD